VIGLLLVPLIANADNEADVGELGIGEPGEQSDPSSVLTNVSSFADNAQKATTDRFNRFVISLDDFFGGAESTEAADQSWGRLRIDAIQPDDDDFTVRARLKLRVVLPESERRLRLLFSNEDGNVKSDQQGIESDLDDQDATVALRFVRSLSDKLSLNFDVGARIRDSKAQVFGRIKASNVRKLRWDIEQRISNNFFLFSASGYRNRLTYDIRRQLKDSTTVFLRSSTRFEAQNGVSGIALNETLGLYADLSSRTSVAFEGLFSVVSSRDDEFDAHYLGSEFRVRFRQNFWRPWFYYEIWPTVSFPVSSDFNREFGGRVRVEMLFGQF